MRHDGCGDLAGGLPQRFGQGQGAIGLEITEFRLAGWAQGWIQGLAVGPGRGGQLREGLVDRRQELLLEVIGDAKHGQGAGSAVVTGFDHPSQALKRMLKSSQGLRVTGALLEIRSMPLAA